MLLHLQAFWHRQNMLCSLINNLAATSFSYITRKLVGRVIKLPPTWGSPEQFSKQETNRNGLPMPVSAGRPRFPCWSPIQVLIRADPALLTRSDQTKLFCATEVRKTSNTSMSKLAFRDAQQPSCSLLFLASAVLCVFPGHFTQQ